MDYSGGFMKVRPSLRTGRKGRRTRRINPRVIEKLKKLQKLIPGGKGLDADRLFVQTANYIIHLKLQVDVLQALSDVSQSS